MNSDTLLIGKNVIEAWRQAVGEAQESISIATYKLTSHSALEALLEAHGRGVEVQIVLDGEEAGKKKSLASEAQRAGLDVMIWPSDIRGKLHVKFSILDHRRVIFGSFNLTESAERNNTEVFFSTDNEILVQDFSSAWRTLREAARSANSLRLIK